MSDQTERVFVPLYKEETEAAIIARLRVWANEGLDPALDPDKWVDTREGSMWWMGVFGMVRELARIYQLMGTEVPMASFVLWAWANYLDDHAEVRNLFRNAAVAATGEVVFTGPGGTLIGDGTPVSVEPPTPDAIVAEFEVSMGGRIELPFPSLAVVDNFNRANGALGAGWDGPVRPAEVEPAVFGNRVTGDPSEARSAYRDDITVDGDGEVFATVYDGTEEVVLYLLMNDVGTSDVNGYMLKWDPGPGSLSMLRIDDDSTVSVLESVGVSMASGDGIGLRRVGSVLEMFHRVAAGSFVVVGNGVTDGTYTSGRVGFGLAASAAAKLDDFSGGELAESTGSITLPIRARSAGEIGNVSAGAISLLMSPTLGVVVTITNPDPTKGGQEAETDEELRKRILDQARLRAGGGTIGDYIQWSGEVAGVGRVTVIAEGRGPGSVVVIISTTEGDPVSDATVDALQTHLDPPAYIAELVNDEVLPTGTIEVTGEVGVARATGLLRLGDQIVAYTGYAGGSFTGCTGGVGSFNAGDSISQSGRALGRAPVGHHVIVLSAAVLNVVVAAVIEHESGYSLDGGLGLSATRQQIEEAVDAYVKTILPGQEVVHAQVLARIVLVEGVHSVVSAPTINGAAADLAVPGDPPQSPVLTLPMTLT